MEVPPEGKYIGVGRADRDTQRDKKEEKEEEVDKKQAAVQQAQVQRGLRIKKVPTQYVWSMPRRILDLQRGVRRMRRSGREKKKLRLVNTDRRAGGKNISDPG